MQTQNQKYITSWGLQQSITNKIPTTERLRLYKHWKNWTIQKRKEEAKKALEILTNRKYKLKLK